MIDNKAIGLRIKDLREMNADTMREVSEAIQITREHYKKIERGRGFSAPVLFSLSEYFGVTTDYILYGR